MQSLLRPHARGGRRSLDCHFFILKMLIVDINTEFHKKQVLTFRIECANIGVRRKHIYTIQERMERSNRPNVRNCTSFLVGAFIMGLTISFRPAVYPMGPGGSSPQLHHI